MSKMVDVKVEFVRMAITDINCTSRGMLVPIKYYKKIVDKGVALYSGSTLFACNGEIILGTGRAEEDDFPNGFMYPDVKTFMQLPWKPTVAGVLVDFRYKACDPASDLIMIEPRNICKNQIKKLEGINMKFFGALEYEFYLLNRVSKTPLDPTINFGSIDTSLCFEDVIIEIMKGMNGIDITPETYHTEYGPTQQEVTMSPAFGISCPDNAIRFKNLVKEIAKKHDILATFMTKPFPKNSGSSGHFNHSIWSIDGQTNLFFENDSRKKFSKLGEHWIAGLRFHFKALSALLCPTTNCNERLVPGCFSPVNNAWGFDNRTVAFRVKNLDQSQTYVENRIPGAGSNPYLVTAGCIVAGMDGIKKKMELNVKPYVGDASMDCSGENPSLPADLEESLTALSSSELFREEFGDEFIKAFSVVKRDEIERMKVANQEDRLYNWYMEFYGGFV